MHKNKPLLVTVDLAEATAARPEYVPVVLLEAAQAVLSAEGDRLWLEAEANRNRPRNAARRNRSRRLEALAEGLEPIIVRRRHVLDGNDVRGAAYPRFLDTVTEERVAAAQAAQRKCLQIEDFPDLSQQQWEFLMGLGPTWKLGVAELLGAALDAWPDQSPVRLDALRAWKRREHVTNLAKTVRDDAVWAQRNVQRLEREASKSLGLAHQLAKEACAQSIAVAAGHSDADILDVAADLDDGLLERFADSSAGGATPAQALKAALQPTNGA